MPPKVSSVKMVSFRGATCPSEISFDTSKSVTLIFGENGTGKSTIADAFDFVCNRAYGSLDNYSLGEPAKKHMASLGCRPSDLKVSLTCGTSTWIASLGKEGAVVSPSLGCPDARILRRKRILDLIEEQPKKRFEALKAFITVPGIEKSENALRDAVNRRSLRSNSVFEIMKVCIKN
jgi:energy-coupling factor transporter ATP-binding protein EcfA2